MMDRSGRSGSEAQLGQQVNTQANMGNYSTHVPSSSFYSKQSNNNLLDPQQKFERKRNDSIISQGYKRENISMKRVDKLTRVSVDKGGIGRSKQPDKTDYNGVFESIMNT